MLEKASRELGREVTELLTCDKLSRVRTTKVLAAKKRVVAITRGDEISGSDRKAQSSINCLLWNCRMCIILSVSGLANNQFLGDPVAATFTEDGGTLLSSAHGVMITVQRGAIRRLDNVKISVLVAMPNMRMDLDNEVLHYRSVGHPVLIQTEPPNYDFLETVEVRIPHCGVVEVNRDGPSLVVFSRPSLPAGQQQATFLRLLDELAAVDDSHATLKTKRLSWFWVFSINAINSRHCVVDVYSPTDNDVRQTSKMEMKLVIYPNMHWYFQVSWVFCSISRRAAVSQSVSQSTLTMS